MKLSVKVKGLNVDIPLKSPKKIKEDIAATKEALSDAKANAQNTKSKDSKKEQKVYGNDSFLGKVFNVYKSCTWFFIFNWINYK